jgi:molybdenum cofactor cytidylyltransferase
VPAEMSPLYHNTSVLIPAAGNSMRMGSHKALLKYDEHFNFIQKIVSEYRGAGVSEVVVVVNSNNAVSISDSLKGKEFGKIKFVLNEYPERERFFSIRCGLSILTDPGNCFIHNCDNPFVDAIIIQKLLKSFRENSVTIPEYCGFRGHPVLISNNIIQAILSHPDNDCNLKMFLEKFPANIISVDSDSILHNINTKRDYLLCQTLSDR